jgi:hypothetical protein
VISIVIHPSVSPATGRTLRSLSVKAFVVPPLSRQQVPCLGELMPRTRSPRRAGDDDQALNLHITLASKN